MHWYLQCLNYAKDCLRELSFDVLKNVNTELLRVSDNGTVDLPCDYVDFTKVGVRYGQFVKPLLQYDKINRLPNYSNGEEVPYAEEGVGLSGVSWVNVSGDGEHLGRMYGLGMGRETDVFKVIPERGIIQFSQELGYDHIVLEYISDGLSSNAATSIHPYAQKTIEAYIEWQLKLSGRHYDRYEKEKGEQLFYRERRILVARMNPITIEDVKRVFKRSYRGSIK